MIQIIPTVLATSEDQYKKDIERFAAVEAFRGGWVHIDFMDNEFVPNKGIHPSVTAKYQIPFKKEAHLMVQNPKEWIDALVQVGFKRVFFHLEADDVEDAINHSREQGLEVGLVLNHETPLEILEPFIAKIDAVLLMSVVPGFQGQPFIEEVFDRIKETSRLRLKSNFNFRIGVDGAVKDANIKALVDAGVDFVIVGSFLLNGNIVNNLENLWEKING